MSDEINDDGAVKFNVGLMPEPMLGSFRQVAQTSRFDTGQAKQMGSSLLYPFYGGKQVPDQVIRTPDYWYLSTFSIHRNAAQIGPGQSVVVIVNAHPNALKITRPYRDGGYMFGIPQDASGTKNHIPGLTTMGGKDFFGVGAYGNGIATIFYGSGAVLYLKSEDSSVATMAVAYGSSINGGSGLGIMADASPIADNKAWFGSTGDKTNFKPGSSLSDSNGKVKITASVAPWDSLTSNNGGLFVILVEPV